jgi:hypothetical protein
MRVTPADLIIGILEISEKVQKSITGERIVVFQGSWFNLTIGSVEGNIKSKLFGVDQIQKYRKEKKR